jgi:Uma2 family endonuclease
MVALEAIPRVTVAHYLESERYTTLRHEYIDGFMYAMGGGTQVHGAIAATVIRLLGQALRGGPCRVYSSDVKVRISETRFVYPDVSLSCDPADRDDAADWIAAPRLVVEVLSESTAAYDRREKFGLYRAVAALREYLLIDTARRRVELYRRRADGSWATEPEPAGAVVALESLGVALAVAEIYEDTAVPPDA